MKSTEGQACATTCDNADLLRKQLKRIAEIDRALNSADMEEGARLRDEMDAILAEYRD